MSVTTHIGGTYEPGSPAPGRPPTVVTPPPPVLRSIVYRTIIPLALGVAAGAIVWPTHTTEARAIIEDIDGAEVTVQIVDHPQPNRFVVEWGGDVREGQTVDVELGGACGCEPVPADSGRLAASLLIGLGVPFVLWVALVALMLTYLVRRRRAIARSEGAAMLPQTATPVWVRPVWTGRAALQLHLDIHERDTGRRLGRVPLTQVTIEMDPWAPYTLLQRGSRCALVTDDGRHMVLPSGVLDPYPLDEKVSLLSEVADEAMRWRPSGRDPAWREAHLLVLRRFRLLTVVYVVAYLGLGFVVPEPFDVVAILLVIPAYSLARRWVRRPLRRLIHDRTGASFVSADIVAETVTFTLIPAVAIDDPERLAS